MSPKVKKIPVRRGFGNAAEIPPYIEKKGINVNRAEMHYTIGYDDVRNRKLNYQYWFFEGNTPVAVHDVSIGGYNNRECAEQGAADHLSQVEKIAGQINPNLKVSFMKKDQLDKPIVEN